MHFKKATADSSLRSPRNAVERVRNDSVNTKPERPQDFAKSAKLCATGIAAYRLRARAMQTQQVRGNASELYEVSGKATSSSGSARHGGQAGIREADGPSTAPGQAALQKDKNEYSVLRNCGGRLGTRRRRWNAPRSRHERGAPGKANQLQIPHRMLVASSFGMTTKESEKPQTLQNAESLRYTNVKKASRQWVNVRASGREGWGAGNWCWIERKEPTRSYVRD